MQSPGILTVHELTTGIKEVLEGVFFEVSVLGEVSNVRQPASGHVYFILKDDTPSQIRCVLFKGAGLRLKFALTDGMQVVVSGRVGVYERDGQYQLYAREIIPKGQGALQLAFEQLKAKLLKEGLFDEARKRALPFLPEAIGVVTSPTGAVIRDILHILNRRFEGARVIVNPVRVQGPEAAEEIASALRIFNELKCVDVVILARGGGSLEDLWAFNEEIVARAIYESEIPVISAIGHETDYTIADFVADCRAPTPSAAAEIVMPSRFELKGQIQNLLAHLRSSFADIVPQHVQRIDDLAGQMERALEQRIKTESAELGGLIHQLEALNPLAILKRGYSITSDAATGRVLFSAKDVKAGERIKTKLLEGEFESQVL